jgi:hypothetical protein
VAGQLNPQRGRPGFEDHGRMHDQCLAVDADLHMGARADLESRGAPLDPSGELAGPAAVRALDAGVSFEVRENKP